MGSIPDPGEVTADLTPPPPSFDDFQRQTSLMTSCTLLWKELSDHFTTLEQNLQKTSDALKRKIQALDTETKDSLAFSPSGGVRDSGRRRPPSLRRRFWMVCTGERRRGRTRG
ncbi:unnamed protein product [Linum trigynum]|uniref:Uncharacterized protein n=1 Tax=Linum trigynum TaxID=586398 RepID=A0AAV2EBS0_9ROSI